MYKDILLILPSPQDGAAKAVLGRGLEVARLMEAHVSGLVIERAVPLPVSRRPYTAALERELAARQAEVHERANAELAVFEEEARRAGLAHEGRLITVSEGTYDAVIERARLRSLVVAPFAKGDTAHADLLQALIFGAGRPVLVLPDNEAAAFRPARVVVAWDAERAAARAVADAMPFLRHAKEVRIVTVLSDKETATGATGPELVAHLARCGAHATLHEVERGRRTVGKVLAAEAENADLLVMGAFGHSRIRDFFLGGATRHMLAGLARPTLFSH
jgi:nucleotide-binding universal stress UspA family protein